jgi:hypothetical protein
MLVILHPISYGIALCQYLYLLSTSGFLSLLLYSNDNRLAG